jgi:hypothetical protein
MSLLDDENILIEDCKINNLYTIKNLLENKEYSTCIDLLNNVYHILDGYSWDLDDYDYPIYSNDNDWLCSLYVILNERTKKRDLVLELHYKYLTMTNTENPKFVFLDKRYQLSCTEQETLYKNCEKILISFELTPNPNHLFYTLL